MAQLLREKPEISGGVGRVSFKRMGGSIIVGLLVVAGDVTASPGPRGISRATPSEQPGLVRELERLTEGLLFMSETDAPITVVTWVHPGGRPTARRIGRLVGEPHLTLVKQTTVDDFFRAATTRSAGQDAEEEIVVGRYAALVRLLKAQLDAIRVFRFGRTTIRSYVVGVAPSGDWIGLATRQTET